MTDADAASRGLSTDDLFGTAVGAVDLDDDGLPDLITGACGVDASGGEGAVYVFDGSLF